MARLMRKLAGGGKRAFAISPVESGQEVSRSRSDEALVEEAKLGVKSAYRELVERYQERIHAVAYGFLGNFQDAEDVTQEAFVKAYVNLKSFRGDASFYTWVYRIVYNLAIDLSRRRYRKAEVPSSDSFMLERAEDDAKSLSAESGGTTAAPDELFERAEFREHFARALGELSSEHRAVIVLREIDGLSYAEIRDVIGCSMGTVMSRIHHARKRLRRVLGEFTPSGREKGA